MSDTLALQPLMTFEESQDVLVQHLTSNEEFMSLFNSISSPDGVTLFANPEEHPSLYEGKSDAVLDIIYKLCAPSFLRNELEKQVLVEMSLLRERLSASTMESNSISRVHNSTERVIRMDRKLIREFRTYNHRLPLSIWHCCQRSCFAVLATDPEKVLVFDEVIRIHEIACECRDHIVDDPDFVQTKRRGVGGSSMVGTFLSKWEREQNCGTDREMALCRLGGFVVDVLPFLCGKADSRTGVAKLAPKLCVHAISCLLDVSYNFIYRRRLAPAALQTSTMRVLDTICGDPSLESKPGIEKAVTGYSYKNGHPINRVRRFVHEKIETYLDMILRPDPGASNGANACRLYSPEINTHKKLRKRLAEQLHDEGVIKRPISSTTLGRMIKDYLNSKNCKISFTQPDHNACPTCKSMRYAVLQFSYERKKLEKELASCKEDAERQPGASTIVEKISVLSRSVAEKEAHEGICLTEMKDHTDRDARIKGFLKQLTDVFRKAYKERLRKEREEEEDSISGWCEGTNEAIVTHQDDMTKVDLPSFIVDASSDITRWRYDINAHVGAITDSTVVFPHEQGLGPKDASSIFELIVLDHILRCRGEAIKFIVSDNAAVGKNWLTTVALPQYLVDQGLADIAMVVFLENNHGKWLADMLFGQLQLRRRRSTLTGVDALLSEFEFINRKNGSVQGFVVNPLSSVSFEKVLKSLGYVTKPRSDFMFVRRNIHFASACAEGGTERLSSGLRELFEEMLPTEPGIVRLCSDPPAHVPQSQIPFVRRYVDVPAAERSPQSWNWLQQSPEDFLVVPTNHPFSEKGNCVLSKRNMEKVGYNGFVFRSQKAYQELQNNNDPLVKQTSPHALLSLKDTTGSSTPEFASPPESVSPPESAFPPELVSGSENLKCARENWIVRRTVSRFRNQDGDCVARYPPRNMINSKYSNGPRSEYAYGDVRWKPTRTYSEPPFPLSFWAERRNTCAYWTLLELQEQYKDEAQSMNVLHLLACIYSRMENREDYSSQWFQKPATKASDSAWERFEHNQSLFKTRKNRRPKAPKTVKQMLKDDPATKSEVARIVQRAKESPGEEKAPVKIANELSEKVAVVPGSLDLYEWLVAKDIERYANELKHFIEVVQKKFDEDNDLLSISLQHDDEGGLS